MTRKHPRVPTGLLISVVITLVVGLAADPIIRANATEQQLTRNVLLSAIPFIFIFVAIILAFISLTWFMATLLNHNISARVHRPIELITIGGIVLGIIGMFQPWSFAAYQYGFYVLLISTLAFILWSHIIPRGAHQDQLGSVSIGEFEQKEGG
jgi:hypothetical protein